MFKDLRISARKQNRFSCLFPHLGARGLVKARLGLPSPGRWRDVRAGWGGDRGLCPPARVRIVVTSPASSHPRRPDLTTPAPPQVSGTTQKMEADLEQHLARLSEILAARGDYIQTLKFMQQMAGNIIVQLSGLPAWREVTAELTELADETGYVEYYR